MNSFGLLRTNVGLTTNIKIMVGSDYSLSLDSIDSAEELSLNKYKKVSFNSKNYYDELIPYFYKNLPEDIAYSIKYENDSDTMGDDFSNQYDEIYQYGARNIINNKSYSEEFEYFAPLYITKRLPKKFIIFRIDGPGIGVLSKDNFKSDILNQLKTIKIFDLSKESKLGEWLDINFISNKFFPKSPLEMDFRNLEFSIWNGIDYKTGGYTSKSRFVDDIIDEEKEIFELEKFIFDSYKENSVVFPNILNLSFLYDDEPATPDEKRKWSLNRYMGFYLEDMELVQTISPYITPFLKEDVVIQENNILYSNSGDPFVEGWSTTRPFYIEYDGNYYKVVTIEENMGTTLQQSQPTGGIVTENYQNLIVTKWKIISDIDLQGKQNDINKNYGYINEEKAIIDYNNNNLEIDEFEESDVWIIEIDGIYHNIILDDGSLKLITDYSFEFNENDYKYLVAGETKTISTVVDFNNPPKKFKIYKLKFSDIKDFDDRVIDTEYSKYEYEKVDELTFTDETKMYFENLLTNSNPKELDDFVYKNEVVNIPVSSEYTANYETFKIENNELSEMWRKNPVYCRWVYQNSLSANDYPYLLNNSNIFEDFNRTANSLDPIPKRIERNLDYFYTINSSTSSYLHHTLHVEKLNESGDIDIDFRFDLGKYLNSSTYSIGTSSTSATYSFDYFTSFFDRNTYFNNSNIKKNVKKYSSFNEGDESIPNNTLFRGIEFSIYDVESITLNESGDVDNFNLLTSNEFQDYKFSILLSENNVLDSITTCFPFETYEVSKQPKAFQQNLPSDPATDPPGLNDYLFEVIGGSEAFISPGDEINITATCSIFEGTFYVNTTIEYANRFFISIVDENDDLLIIDETCSGTVCFTKITPSNSLDWTIIDDWKMDKEYATGSIVVFNDILYVSNTNVITSNPVKSISLLQVKSAPYNQSEWTPVSSPYLDIIDNIFWTPDYDYSSTPGKFIYNGGDFYYYDSSGTEDIWNPYTASNTGYDYGDVVLFNGQYYMSMTSSNIYDPNYKRPFVLLNRYQNFGYWVATQSSSPKWKPIQLWNPSETYDTPSYSIPGPYSYVYVVHNDIIWEGNIESPSGVSIIEPGEEPSVSARWIRRYSLEPDTDYVYQNTDNAIISMNNRYYLCNNNSENSTLDNGIIIYINKKWKNILLNINISDNTLPNLSEKDRDELYDDLYSKLTAFNIINSVNNITLKNGFTDYLTYIIIDEDDNVTRHNYEDNLSSLPYLMRCNLPDEFFIKVNSLDKDPIENPKKLRANRVLKDGKISSISQLNYYNNLPMSVSIKENKYPPKVFENYHGNKNIVSNSILRFSGFYMPLFYDIQIFEKDSEFRYSGNYKFDTSLTDFGMMKERKISKINRKGSVLKLKDEEDIKSIYPMLDEFGYSVKDFFIFSSTWDYKYHVETILLNIKPDIQISSPTIVPTTIGRPKLIGLLQNFRR